MQPINPIGTSSIARSNGHGHQAMGEAHVDRQRDSDMRRGLASMHEHDSLSKVPFVAHNYLSKGLCCNTPAG